MSSGAHIFACLLLSTCVFYTVSSPENRSLDPFSQAMARMNGSVFPIVCGKMLQPGNKFSALSIAGTGVFVDSSGHFITASHVITKNFPEARKSPTDAFQRFTFQEPAGRRGDDRSTPTGSSFVIA